MFEDSSVLLLPNRIYSMCLLTVAVSDTHYHHQVIRLKLLKIVQNLAYL